MRKIAPSGILVAVFIVIALASPSHADFNPGSWVKDVVIPKPSKEQKKSGKNTAAPGISAITDLTKEEDVEEEVAIGREIAGRVLGASPLVDDEGLQLYVSRVGTWVAVQSGRTDLVWHFGVIESDDINAFAAPGGYILITRGLYKKLANEAELAGVLGHEIGHVTQKHHLKILKKGKLINLGGGLLKSIGGGLLKDKVGGMGGDLAEKSVGNLIGSGAEVMARGLDKGAEYEADRIGVVLATRAGYDSYGLPAVLQEIGHSSSEDSSVSLLFKTHPHPDERMVELGDSMGETFDRYDQGKTLSGRLYRIE